MWENLRIFVKACSHPHFHHSKAERREEHGKSKERKGEVRVIRKSREWRKGGQTCISGQHVWRPRSLCPRAHFVLAIRHRAVDRAAAAIFSFTVTQVKSVPWGQLLQGPEDISPPTMEQPGQGSDLEALSFTVFIYKGAAFWTYLTWLLAEFNARLYNRAVFSEDQSHYSWFHSVPPPIPESKYWPLPYMVCSLLRTSLTFWSSLLPNTGLCALKEYLLVSIQVPPRPDWLTEISAFPLMPGNMTPSYWGGGGSLVTRGLAGDQPDTLWPQMKICW